LSIMSEPTYFARVEDDVVVGVYVADAEWVSNQPGTWVESTKENLAWIGATVTDDVFELLPVSDEEEI